MEILEMLSNPKCAANINNLPWIPVFIALIRALPANEKVEAMRGIASILTEEMCGAHPISEKVWNYNLERIGVAFLAGIRAC